MIESQEHKLKMMDSQFSQDFQIKDPYSIFQVPQQEEELNDLEKSMKFMIQSQKNYINPKIIPSIS